MRLWWKSGQTNADLLAFEGEFLTFQVDRPLPLDHSEEVQAHLPDGLHFHARLRIKHVVPADEALRSFIDSLGYAPRQHVYCGVLEDPKAGEDSLRILLESLPRDGGHHHRLARRVVRQIEVTSPDRPLWHASTHDISLTGVCLHTDRPLEPGQTMNLKLAFDDEAFAPLEVEAEVRWCRPARVALPEAEQLVGVHFLNPDEAVLEGFVRAALSDVGGPGPSEASQGP